MPGPLIPIAVVERLAKCDGDSKALLAVVLDEKLGVQQPYLSVLASLCDFLASVSLHSDVNRYINYPSYSA